MCINFLILWQYYIFAYVDAPGYQILKNFNIISTGVLYRIILKKRLDISSFFSLDKKKSISILCSS